MHAVLTASALPYGCTFAGLVQIRSEAGSLHASLVLFRRSVLRASWRVYVDATPIRSALPSIQLELRYWYGCRGRSGCNHRHHLAASGSAARLLSLRLRHPWLATKYRPLSWTPSALTRPCSVLWSFLRHCRRYPD